MILKLLLIIGVIYAVYYFFIKQKPQVKSNKAETRDKAEPNDMIECASCGVYCEIDETILSNGSYYCSQECVEKG